MQVQLEDDDEPVPRARTSRSVLAVAAEGPDYDVRIPAWPSRRGRALPRAKGRATDYDRDPNELIQLAVRISGMATAGLRRRLLAPLRPHHHRLHWAPATQRTSRLLPRKKSPNAAFRERLKGFEPSTFCMQSCAGYFGLALPASPAGGWPAPPAIRMPVPWCTGRRRTRLPARLKGAWDVSLDGCLGSRCS